MKETKLEHFDVTVRHPDEGSFLVGYIDADRESAEIKAHDFHGMEATIMLARVFASVLKDEPDIIAAGLLGVFRRNLKEAGVIGDTIDMAVAFHGRVLPLDELEAEAEEEKDR